MRMKMSRLMSFYNLKSLVRYQLRSRIRGETVAEHSYFVSLLVIEICDALKVKDAIRLEAIQLAILHDLPEAFISDIPHSVKSNNSKLKDIVREMELMYITYNMPNQKGTFENPYKESKLIVELADILSCVQYCKSEFVLGNKGLYDIYMETLERIQEINKEFKKMFNQEFILEKE